MGGAGRGRDAAGGACGGGARSRAATACCCARRRLPAACCGGRGRACCGASGGADDAGRHAGGAAESEGRGQLAGDDARAPRGAPCGCTSPARAAAAAAAAAAPNGSATPPAPRRRARGGGARWRRPAPPRAAAAVADLLAAASPATDVTALPPEVLGAVVDALPDRDDRAAFAAAFAAARAAVAAAAQSVTIPAAALLLGASPECAPALAAALARHSRASRVAVGGPLPPAIAAPNTGGPWQLAFTLVSSLGSMRHLRRLDFGAAPAALFERLPLPLLRSLAGSCSGLEELSISAQLWHAPAQAAVLRVMARGPPPACAPPACAAPGGAPPPPAARWGAAQPQQQLAAALLGQALAAQAMREHLGALAALPRLSALAIAGSLPPDVLPQIACLPPGVTRLAIHCALLSDDAALGRALGAARGLRELSLVQLPSADGALFDHMTGGFFSFFLCLR